MTLHLLKAIDRDLSVHIIVIIINYTTTHTYVFTHVLKNLKIHHQPSYVYNYILQSLYIIPCIRTQPVTYKYTLTIY